MNKTELEKENAKLRRHVAKLEKQLGKHASHANTSSDSDNGQDTEATPLHRADAQRTQLAERLALATRSAQVGIWDWDIRNNVLIWDDRMYELYGRRQDEFSGAYDAWLSGIHPDDRAMSDEISARARAGEIEYDTEFRVIWPDGSVHWLKSNGEVFRDEYGAPFRMLGVNYDITARKHAEQQLDASRRFALSTLDALMEHICVLDEQGNILFVNRAWREFADANPPTPPNYAVGSNYIDICDAASGGDAEMAHTFAQGIRAVRNGESEHFYSEYPCHSPEQQRWFIGRVSRFPGQGETRILVTHENITERKNTERRIRQNEQTYAAMFQQSAVPMALTQMPQVVFVDINEAFQTTFGYSHEQVVGKTSVEIGMALADERLQTIVNMAQFGSITDNEKHLMTKSGELRIGLINANRITIDNQDLVITSIHDVTERKRAEQALRESEQRLSSVLINSPDTIYAIDLDTRKVNFLNRPEFCGYTRDDMEAPNSLLQAIDPADVARVRESWQRMISQGIADPIEYRLRRKDGCLEWVEQRMAVLQHNPDHAPHQILVTLSLVTERKHAEDKLRKLSHAVEQSPAAIVITDPAGNIEYVNPRFTQLTGYTLEEALGKNPRILKSGEMTPVEYKRLWSTITQGKEWRGEFHNKKKNGELYWEQASISPVFDSQGRIQNYLAVKEDITERKQAEAHLIKLAERLELATRSAQIGIWDWDIQNNVLVWDRRMYELYGRREDEFGDAYATWLNSVHPDDRAVSAQVAERAQRGEIEYDTEFCIILPDGSVRWLKANAQVYRDEHGTPIRMIGVNYDITERKQAEAVLRESEQKYRNLSVELEERVQQRTVELQDLYDNAPTGYHSLDAQGNILMINQTELDWLGYTRTELIGQPIASLLTPAGQLTFQSNFPIFKERGWVRDLEFELIRKDGTTFPALISTTAIKDEDGNYAMSRSTVFDITERKQAEVALRENEATYRALFENASDAIFLIHPDSTYLGVNPRAVELLGVASAEALVGRASTDFTDTTQAQDVVYRRQTLLAGERLAPYERTFIRADGTRVETEVTLSLVRDHQGNPKIIQSLVRDITARKQAEQALQRANVEMERAMRLKDEFLAGMSHELRTPLNSILGLSQVLSEQIIGPLNERQLATIGIVESSGKHLLALINDILDLSKIEAGAVSLAMTSVDVQSVCQASLAFIKQTAHKKGIGLSNHFDLQVQWITADERCLKQMLVNLLNNAVKFTPTGGQITLRVTGDVARRSVRFSVSDTGIGIAPEDQTRLFKPFVQVDSSLTRAYEGTGLGLALVARMAEMHGGSVFVESELGKGSCFTIELPWSEAMQVYSEVELGGLATTTKTNTPTIEPTAQGSLILIAEDHEANIQTFSMYLQAKGYRVAIARNGSEALDLARAERPALILMDIQMPVLDGLETTRRLRLEPDPEIANIPVIALTAHAMVGDREQALTAGANGYLSKPVKLKELVELIQHLHQGGITG